MTQNRPQTGEYARYYEKYIALVPGGDLEFSSVRRATMALVGSLDTAAWPEVPHFDGNS